MTATLLIALDAAEPSFVRELMAAGEMPVLAGLAERGSWARVTSSAHIGSGSVWATFASGRSPVEHGRVSAWRWDPAAMRTVFEPTADVRPWWAAHARHGERVLALDVPYLSLARAGDGCTEIAEWGSHDRTRGLVETLPASLAAEIARDVDPHPYQHERPPSHDSPSSRALAELSRLSCEGARRRGELACSLIGRLAPDLALITFAETHHASHLLWHSVEPDHPLFADLRRRPTGERVLVDVFRAVDAAVGRIIEAVGVDARIVVFSLHGMRPGRGLPTLMHPLLVDLGYAAAPRGTRLTARDAGRTAFAMAKRRAPGWVRDAYRRRASHGVLRAIAAPTAMAAYDWDRTRAFAVPTDQHGLLRINLAGREARGIVPAKGYAATCDELSEALRGARTADGRPLVRKILRLADDNGGRPPADLPDLIVHWSDAACADPVRVAGGAVTARPDGRRLTGQHAFDGFVVSVGASPHGDVVASHELCDLVRAG